MGEVGEVRAEFSPTQSPRPQLQEIFKKDWREPGVVIASLGIDVSLVGPGEEKKAANEWGSFTSTGYEIYDPGGNKIGSSERKDWHGRGYVIQTPGQPLPKRVWTEVFVFITEPGNAKMTDAEFNVWFDASGRAEIINNKGVHRPGQPVRSWTATRDFDDAGRVVRVSRVDGEKGLGGEEVNRSQAEKFGPDGNLLSSKESHYKTTNGSHVIMISEAGIDFNEDGTPARRWERQFDPKTGEIIGQPSLERPSATSSQTSNLARPGAGTDQTKLDSIRRFLRRLIRNR